MLAAAFWHASHCRESVASFVENDVAELSDVDLAVARLRLLPYYERLCSAHAGPLDEYGRQLDRETRLRYSHGKS